MACCAECARTGGSCGGRRFSEGLGQFDLSEWAYSYEDTLPSQTGQYQHMEPSVKVNSTVADRIMAPQRALDAQKKAQAQGLLGMSSNTWLMIGAGVLVVGALMGGRGR